MVDVNKLLKMQKKIETAKKEKAEANGELKALMTQLKTDFGITTVEEAQHELAKIIKREEELETKLEAIMEELESNYDWN